MNKKQKIGFASSILNKMMNITHDEWPRIAVAWLLHFLYRLGFIVAWTVLISLFITRFGILALPYFFILFAVFRVIGAFIYGNVINNFRKDNIILFTALIGALLLLIALSLEPISELLFIFLAIPIVSIFFSQLYIVSSAFKEELFSPLESERTFPIIESAETIGGIIGGLLIAFFVTFSQPIFLMHIVIASLALIIPIIAFHRQILKKLPFIQFRKKKKFARLTLDGLKKNIDHMKNIPFLKVLFFVILTQWIFTNLLEFQYTTAVYENIGSEAANPAQELTHGLGSLQILFHSLALLMQLFVAGRIISSLGIIGSLLLHPVVALFSLGSLLFKFGFSSAVLAKTNFEMTNIIHKNAYHTSYYAIKPDIREQVRELLEGFVHPIGTVIGMGTLLILEQFIFGENLNFAITIFMTAIMTFMLFILLKNETKYTHISAKNLLHTKDPKLQLNAIEVLGQKGHRSGAEILTRKLQEQDLTDPVKIKILDTLGHMKSDDSILEILDAAYSKNKKVRTAAIKALDKFDFIEKNKTKYPFSNYRANDTLQNLFAHEEDNEIKALIVQILTKINKNKIVPFLLKLLKTSDDRLKADCIAACGNFDDANLAYYIFPYLESHDPRIRAYTIVTLWKFKKYRVKLMEILKQMLYSTAKQSRLEAYYAIGEIKGIQEKNRLKQSLTSDDHDEAFVAAIALAKMGFNEGIPVIIDTIMDGDDPLSLYATYIQDKLPEHIVKSIQRSIRLRVSEYINVVLADTKKTSLEDLDKNTLMQLRRAYELVNEHEEVHNIDELILQLNPN